MKELEGVETFVGIDAHSCRCSIKAISQEGMDVLVEDAPTERRALQAALQGLPRPAWGMVEASTLAPLIRDYAAGMLDRLIVCETRENRWSARFTRDAWYRRLKSSLGRHSPRTT